MIILLPPPQLRQNPYLTAHPTSWFFPFSLSLLKQFMKIKTKNKFLSVCLSDSFACMCRVPGVWLTSMGENWLPHKQASPANSCLARAGTSYYYLPLLSAGIFVWFELVKAWRVLSRWLYMHFKGIPTFWISVDKPGKTQVVVGFILSLPPRFWDYRHLPLQPTQNTQNFIELKQV